MSLNQNTPSPGLLARIRMISNPFVALKDNNPLRIGILGAADIAPPAVIIPAKSMSSVEVAAVAARDKAKAEAYAKKHNIPTVHSSYDDIIQDPTLDAVYIPLPNGLHFEWAKKSLEAGKHVLLEKPSVSNSAQAAAIVALARKHPNLTLLEAFHYRFHPACRRLKELVDLGTYGSPKHIYVRLSFPSIFGSNNIRFNPALAGGATMDTGSYTVNMARWIAGEEPEVVENAQASVLSGEKSNQIDYKMVAALKFPNGCTAHLEHALKESWFKPWLWIPNVRVETDTHTLELPLFVMPFVWHTLVVKNRQSGKVVKKEKIYAEGWTTYRYQLEAFVKAIRTGQKDKLSWAGGLDDIVGNMRAIDMIYEKSGLERRS